MKLLDGLTGKPISDEDYLEGLIYNTLKREPSITLESPEMDEPISIKKNGNVYFVYEYFTENVLGMAMYQTMEIFSFNSIGDLMIFLNAHNYKFIEGGK